MKIYATARGTQVADTNMKYTLNNDTKLVCIQLFWSVQSRFYRDPKLLDMTATNYQPTILCMWTGDSKIPREVLNSSTKILTTTRKLAPVAAIPSISANWD